MFPLVFWNLIAWFDWTSCGSFGLGKLDSHWNVRISLVLKKSVVQTICLLKHFWLKCTWKLCTLFYQSWLTLRSLNPIFWLWLSHHIILQLSSYLWLTILNCYLTVSIVNSWHHHHHGHMLNYFSNCQLTHYWHHLYQI